MDFLVILSHPAGAKVQDLKLNDYEQDLKLTKGNTFMLCMIRLWKLFPRDNIKPEYSVRSRKIRLMWVMRTLPLTVDTIKNMIMSIMAASGNKTMADSWKLGRSFHQSRQVIPQLFITGVSYLLKQHVVLDKARDWTLNLKDHRSHWIEVYVIFGNKLY